MASLRSVLYSFFLLGQFLLLIQFPLPLPLTTFTIISPPFPLLFRLGQFLRCRLRQRDIKLANKFQIDVYLLCPISDGTIRRVDENLVYKLIDHWRGQHGRSRYTFLPTPRIDPLWSCPPQKCPIPPGPWRWMLLMPPAPAHIRRTAVQTV